MKRNIGNTDRTLSILVALVILYLYFTEQINGKTVIISLIISGALILTSFISLCPLYLPFGISTRKKNTANEH